MLRTILIYLSQAAWARKLVTGWGFAWRAASRFVAGEQLEDAIQAVKTLNSKGINATLDHLGEHTSSVEGARQATNDVMLIIEAIDREGVRSNVSIKLTQIGLELDEALCAENLLKIVEAARINKTFIRLDMEDSQWVEKSINLFRQTMKSCGCENLGIAIQSYLYRSEADLAELLEEGARIRLCKGAYKEPDSIAFPHKADVDANFDLLVQQMLNGAMENDNPRISMDGKLPPIPAIATHDEARIDFAKQLLEHEKIPKDAIEFQMLYGIRRDLQESLAAEGFPVRVYVPFGSEWYPYYTRRLAERPANMWFFVSNFFR